MSFKQLLIQWLCVAVGVVLAANTNAGITYAEDYGVLFAIVVLLSLLNMVIKPLLMVMTLPFIVLTMGLGLWIINAFLFFAVAKLVDGFYVASFGSALWGALWVSLASFVGGLITKQPSLAGRMRMNTGPAAGGSSTNPAPKPHSAKPPSKKDDDVIDI